MVINCTYYNRVKTGKSGFININEDVVIDLEFQDASSFSEGLATASIDGVNYGFIDKSGKIVIKNKCYDARNFSEGFAVVEINNGWGYINTKGEWVYKPKGFDLW